jgi:hypothetical protein
MSQHSAVGGRSTIGGIRVREPETRKPPREAALEKHANAILGRHHVPAVIKSRGLAGLCHARTLAAQSVGRKPFVRPHASADGDDKWPKEGNKILLGSAMLDQTDHCIGPRLRVFDYQRIAVYHQEFGHRDKGSAFITLLERMGLGDTANSRTARATMSSSP